MGQTSCPALSAPAIRIRRPRNYAAGRPADQRRTGNVRFCGIAPTRRSDKFAGSHTGSVPLRPEPLSNRITVMTKTLAAASIAALLLTTEALVTEEKEEEEESSGSGHGHGHMH